MLNRCLLACILFFGCYGAAWSEVGRVAAANGNIAVIAADGTSRTIRQGDLINAGDTISTPEQGWVILRMIDGASLSLRPNSQMAIGKYAYIEDQAGADQAVFSLIKGALRSITGLIGKRRPSSYRLSTPTATIGIRGTDHETVFMDEQHATQDMPSGTYDNVNAGRTVLHGAQGDVSIEPGKVGYLHPSGSKAPSLLTERPKFFDRMQKFDQRPRISRVLERLHHPLGNGAFDAHPDLKERMKREWPNAGHANRQPAAKSTDSGARAKKRAKRKKENANKRQGKQRKQPK